MKKTRSLFQVFVIIFLFIIINNSFSQNTTYLRSLSKDEDCIAPFIWLIENQNNVLIFDFQAETNWYPLWLQYDDGINTTEIGFDESFSYASKWLPGQLGGFTNTFITKVKFFPTENTDFTLKIWRGIDVNNLVYSQNIPQINVNEWNEVILNDIVEIIPEEGIWVGFEVQSNGQAAGGGIFTGHPNSDLVKVNGAEWQHLSDYGLEYSWNLGVYVDGDKSFRNSKELLGFNLFRNDELLNDELITNMYYDTLPGSGLYCYKGTAVYSICGESDYGNEVCYEYGGTLGFTELNNSMVIFPNPANDHFKIESIEPISSVIIYNQIGQQIFKIGNIHRNEFQLDLSPFENGIYFIEIWNDAHIRKSKLIIQR